jgi:homoserine dehydrogenase
MALFNYHKRDYSKAIEEASKVKADDLSYKHQLKSLYLKIYFDMNNYESFYSHVDTYKHFIKFDKHVTQANKEVLSNYINFTKKLFDIKNNPEDKDFDFIKLKKEIIDSKSMINKSWLLRKIDEIKSSFQR